MVHQDREGSLIGKRRSGGASETRRAATDWADNSQGDESIEAHGQNSIGADAHLQLLPRQVIDQAEIIGLARIPTVQDGVGRGAGHHLTSSFRVAQHFQHGVR